MRGKAGQRQPKGRFWNKNWNLFHPRLMGREARDTGEEKGAEHPPPPAGYVRGEGGQAVGGRTRTQNTPIPKWKTCACPTSWSSQFLLLPLPGSTLANFCKKT